ncbi:MAG TPA: YndJ family protein [Blastocatellia bacterium]|nr:YndJ family protein [Blastocatellia bacterium]
MTSSALNKSGRWLRSSAICGTVVWLLVQFLLPNRTLEISLTSRLVLLSMLVLTPLALSLVPVVMDDNKEPFAYFAARLLQPFAAAAATISFLLNEGKIAAELASLWLVFTILVALFGLGRLIQRPTGFEQFCVVAAALYLPVGGTWLVASRLGYRPLGFSTAIVLLTAMHFHYAGFAAPVITAMVGHRIRQLRPSSMKIFNSISIGVIAGTPLLAAGITFSPVLEVISAVILSLSLMGICFLMIGIVVPDTRNAFARTFLLISSISVFAGMLFATGYSIGSVSGHPIISIPQMVESHGIANAFGFTLCALLAFVITQSKDNKG